MADRCLEKGNKKCIKITFWHWLRLELTFARRLPCVALYAIKKVPLFMYFHNFVDFRRVDVPGDERTSVELRSHHTSSTEPNWIELNKSTQLVAVTPCVDYCGYARSRVDATPTYTVLIRYRHGKLGRIVHRVCAIGMHALASAHRGKWGQLTPLEKWIKN